MTKRNLGIDLGTTNSCAAFVDGSDDVVVAMSIEGDRTVPSVVLYDVDDPDATPAVGKPAKDMALAEPDGAVFFAKRHMGTGAPVATVCGRDVRAEEVSSLILKKMAGDAANSLPEGDEVGGCVVTVPAYFGAAENKATEAAARIAGLNLVCLLQEPVAAAVSYGIDRLAAGGEVMVFDLGGGTLDVSAVRLSRGQDGKLGVEVVCNDGDKYLGGADFDGLIGNFIKGEFLASGGSEADLDDFALASIRKESEELKKQLTGRERARVVPTLGGRPFAVEMARTEFEAMAAGLLERSLDITRSCLETARSKGCNPSKLLLVGGSSRMPMVEARLREEFGGMEVLVHNPDEAIARGAAVYASLYASRGGQEDGGWTLPTSQPQAVEVRTVTVKSFGVLARSSATGQMGVANIIVKNDRIDPETHSCERSMRFATEADCQTGALIEVYQDDVDGPGCDPSDAVKVAEGELDLSGLGLPAGSPVEVTLVLDDSGLLSARAVEPGSGNEVAFDVRIEGALSDEEVEELEKRIGGLVL